MRKTLSIQKTLPLAGLGLALGLGLSGCGGTSTTTNGIAPNQDSGPVIYGLSAGAASNTGQPLEASGLESADLKTAYLTGATKYTTISGAGPLPVLASQFSTGIPLGFPLGGSYVSGAIGTAAPTTGSFVFGASISTGVRNGNKVDLNTSSVVLKSTDDPTFSQPLTFNSAAIGNNPIGNAQYFTAPFTLTPTLAKTGLHNFYTTLSDTFTPPQSSRTDFDVAVVAPTDAAVMEVVTATVPSTSPAKTTATLLSTTATITNAIAGARAQTNIDAQDNIILFAAPGSQTITVTATVELDLPDGTTQDVIQTGTDTETLTAGQLLIVAPDSTGNPILVSGSTPAPTGSVRAHARRK